MTIGENIKKIRKEKRLTQKQLGDKCGINEANIRKYENGKQNPKIETLRKIAEALDISLQELLFGHSKPKNDDLSWFNNCWVIKMLNEIYPTVECKTIKGELFDSIYYLITDETGKKMAISDNELEYIEISSKEAVQRFIEFSSQDEENYIKEATNIINNIDDYTIVQSKKPPQE